MTVSAAPDTAVHAFVLTLDEELHIERCIRSIQPYCASILIVDSGSKDRTVEIARSFGAEVLEHPFLNYADQANVAIDHLRGKGGWILRIDADEVLENPGRPSLITPDETAAGLMLRRHIYFLNRRMKHGGLQPNWHLRLWRNGLGSCEQRWMDEHILLDGRARESDIEFSDINLKPVTWWTAKHNGYASREAVDFLDARYRLLDGDRAEPYNLHGQAKLKRFVKQRIFFNLPGALRAKAYFFYRYWLALGFLDGKAGYYFHFLQAYWYRTLVDCKVLEIEQYRRDHSVDMKVAIEKMTGIRLP